MNCCKENKDGDSKEIGENLSKEVTCVWDLDGNKKLSMIKALWKMMPSSGNSVGWRLKEGMSLVDLKKRNKAKPHEQEFPPSSASLPVAFWWTLKL